MELRRELLAYSRACEHVLSIKAELTEDERGLLEYYVNELSREVLSDKPVENQAVTVKSVSAS
jgi:predicted nucleic acid-binding Zn finger protein